MIRPFLSRVAPVHSEIRSPLGKSGKPIITRGTSQPLPISLKRSTQKQLPISSLSPAYLTSAYSLRPPVNEIISWEQFFKSNVETVGCRSDRGLLIARWPDSHLAVNQSRNYTVPCSMRKLITRL